MVFSVGQQFEVVSDVRGDDVTNFGVASKGEQDDPGSFGLVAIRGLLKGLNDLLFLVEVDARANDHVPAASIWRCGRYGHNLFRVSHCG